MKRSLVLAAGIALLAPLHEAALAQSLPVSRGQLDVYGGEPMRAAPGDEIVITGEVRASAPLRVVLRIDDGQSSTYGSRVNDERTLPSGPFEWRLTLAGARTSSGKLVDATDIRRIMLFTPSRDGSVEVRSATLRPAEPLPAGAAGFSFGGPDAPLFPGFERVSPGDRRIIQGPAIPIRRPGVDPLIGSGLRGLEKVRLSWPQGRARVSLWTEDVGEWETLPHALRRRIRVNGVDIHDERLTPPQWIAARYLANRDAEAGASPDSWEAYGRRRGGLITAEVDVGEHGLTIELAGESPVATFVSAILVEPAGQRAALDETQARRARWFRAMWRVAEHAPDAAPLYAFGPSAASVQPLRLTIAGGAGASFAFDARASVSTQKPAIAIEAPASGSASLKVDLWSAQRRLDRRDVGLNLLRPDVSMLRGEPSALPLQAEVPRRYVGWVHAPEDAAAGVYTGRVRITTAEGDLVAPLEIEVLPARLPPATRPAGFYLDEAPHLTWFAEQGGERRRQLTCDVAFLSALGVRGNAPALSTPTPEDDDRFIVDSLTAARGGLAAPWLAYTPAKRLRARFGVEAAAGKLANSAAALRELGLAVPVWSVADEPSNPDHSEGDLGQWTRALRRADPKARLAAQLNSPADLKLLHLFDVAMINDGFGLDVDHVSRAAQGGREVWLYNTGRPRLTAGRWLAITGAARYVQWHARMPTADPFDPTDGREGDVQMFFPTPLACPPRPDIHHDVLRMAEGVADQRWIDWLRGRGEPEARALLARIEDAAPRRWREAVTQLDAGAAQMRASIVDLARRMK